VSRWLALLLLAFCLALPLGLQAAPPPGSEGQHEHAEEVDADSHLPVQVYYWQAFLMQPWREQATVKALLVQTGVLAALAVALWLWLRRWRLSG
jgi:hypothetical protein